MMQILFIVNKTVERATLSIIVPSKRFLKLANKTQERLHVTLCFRKWTGGMEVGV